MHSQFLQRRSVFLIAGVLGVMGMGMPAWGQVVNEDLKILPTDGAEENSFGVAIDTDNGLVVVGSYYDDDNGYHSGSAYVFDAATGVQIVKLLPSDGQPVDQFGVSVAIDSGVVVVGAYLHDDNGSNVGAAYLFDALTGVQLAKLLPADSPPTGLFGWSVAIGNGMAVVGAFGDDTNGDTAGSVYVFDVATGNQLSKLVSNDTAEGDRFGYSVAIDNGIVAVGASLDDDNGVSSGSAYLFDASTGAQIRKLLASDGAEGDFFGRAVGFADGLVVVGSHGDDDFGDFSGSAYIFDAATGNQLAKLLPSDGAAGDDFGSALSISDGVVLVGARLKDDLGNGSGAAYLFDASTGAQISKLLASDGAQLDQLGESVSIDNGTVAIGAIWDADNGFFAGSSYIFSVASCRADLTGDGELNFFDVSAFLAAFSKGNPVADFTGDGNYNFFDVSAFLSEFALGCP